ncbi:HD domain-containing protein [Aggregicoccus sp. 17bor-14]|uniref:HD domain-containing protein n=1 Tax=Myxococcaceae TaxID=31 RepID=UPI00129CC08C|nr:MULTISPECIES: HD domain-containing protein [Myxococcaceae]MBF5044780.1 HD domain-containing protein [Simulacricoccus sp. 17bor-14]MRI90524.1 HD domain-containing protein [Aggregicoccus sp. 17bor-14]
MKTKAPAPISLLQGRRPLPLLEAYFEANQLKQLYRQGWLRTGLPPERCESVAEHSFGVALLCLLVIEAHFPEADASRAVRIALLHDLGEAYVGDLTPASGVDKAEKHRLEREAVHRILGKLPRGEVHLALWEEYEAGSSFEARLVRQLDRLEMGLQACIYEGQGVGDLSEFFASVHRALETPALQALLAELETLRPGKGA